MHTAPPIFDTEPAREHFHGSSIPIPVQRAHWVTIGCLVASLAIAPLLYGSVDPSAYCFVAALVLTATLAWGVEQWIYRDSTIHVSPLLLPGTMLLAVALVQISFSLSAYSYLTAVEAVKLFFCGLLIFLVTQAVHTDRELRWFVGLLGAFGFAIALFSLLQQWSGATQIYGFHSVLHPQNMYGPFANRDHYAGWMELLAPLPLAVSFAVSLPRAWRILCASASVIMAASVVLSASRGGLVAILAEIVFIGLYMYSAGRGKKYFALLVLFFAATCAFLYWVDATPALLRWKQLNPGEELTSGRLAIAMDALRMVKEHPFMGFGLGTFTTVYPQYRSFYTDLIVNEVHNDYLQTLVETGLVGAAAMIWFLITLYRGGMMSRRSTRGDVRDLIRLGALTGCTGLLVHSFFDFNLHIPANALMFFALAAIVSLPARQHSGGRA